MKSEELVMESLTIVRKLLSSFARLKIYVHQSGQLMRTFEKVAYEKLLFHISSISRHITISPTLVSVLRKRPDANEPCNPDLYDDDEQVRSQIMSLIGCIPPYWKPLQSKPIDLNDCKSSLQLKKAYDQIKQYKTVMNNYDPPCDEMSILSVLTIYMDSFLTIQIPYTGDKYEEIINEKDFGVEMFWSSIGGFIGIFLGYSLLQLPEIILDAWKLAKNTI